MPKPQRVLMLVHPEYHPDKHKPSAERDVYMTLRRMGHDVRCLGLRYGLVPLVEAIKEFRPHVAFNLLEELADEAVFDFHAVSFLEAQGVAITGCNPRGLVLSRNKFWTYSVLREVGLSCPETALLPAQGLSFPTFIKFNKEHSSLAVRNSNRVSDQGELARVARRMHQRLHGELLAQKFISGREVSVSVVGHRRPQVFFPRELVLQSHNHVATESVKFNAQYRQRRRIRPRPYRGPFVSTMMREAARAFVVLELSGYARFDFRVNDEGCYLIDVNANPNLARDEDVACSARAAGWSYEDLIAKILNLARTYRPRR